MQNNLIDESAEKLGDTQVEIAIAVRRYKSERNLSLGTELKRLQLATGNPVLREGLAAGEADLSSITRARQVEIQLQPDPSLEQIAMSKDIMIGIEI